MKKHILIIAITACCLGIYWMFNHGPQAEKFHCVDSYLSENENGSAISLQRRGQNNFALLKGMVSNQKIKQEIIDHIKNSCQLNTFEDFVEVNTNQVPLQSWVNFSIDNVNNVINVSGQLNRQSELKNIIDSLNETGKKIMHNVYLDKKIPHFEFAEHITFLLSTINNIQLADVTIYAEQIVIKGLIRDDIRHKQTIGQIHTLFAEQFTIIDKLETVVKNTADIEALDIDFEPLPPPDFEQ